MKIKKYGYSEFKESTTMRFAVMVPLYEYDKENPDPITGQYPIKSQTMAFVTDIWVNGHREWKAENNKEAYLWDTRKAAQDFCIGLTYNWTSGFVVECLDGMKLANKW